MTLETISFAGNAIEVAFLQQQGGDPFTTTHERTVQMNDVASWIARFIGEAKSTLDIAIYDFRLHDEPAIVADALRSQARKGVRSRIVYDHAIEPGPRPEVIPAVAPSHLEADQKLPGTDSFVRAFADVAEVHAGRKRRGLEGNHRCNRGCPKSPLRGVRCSVLGTDPRGAVRGHRPWLAVGGPA